MIDRSLPNLWSRSLELAAFVEYHSPALETDEVRHNLMLGLLGGRFAAELRLWSLGEAGACAIQTPGYPLILGPLSREQCRQLAEETRDMSLPGVVGTDETAKWFVERAVEFGQRFREPFPQRIHALRETPHYPGAPGHSRRVSAADTTVFAEWLLAFFDEAVPNEPKPPRERIEQAAGDGQYLFWVVDNEPVSMAGIVRRTRHAAAIAGVYTPPALRGRGYAGAVTAANVERIFAEGRTAACLYTDLRNPMSNRCYAKIGFQPVCASFHFERDA
jgi:RimJ/RimL family protein N-acetyltransferase